jgi:hypothetical protein
VVHLQLRGLLGRRPQLLVAHLWHPLESGSAARLLQGRFLRQFRNPRPVLKSVSKSELASW